MLAGELADVVHLPVNHEPPLFVASRALRHLVPGEVARDRPLGRGLGGHRGRAMPRTDWAREVRRAHGTRGVARTGLECSGSQSAGARLEPAARASGFQQPRWSAPSPAARASIGRAAWRGDRVPAFPPAPSGRALQEGRGRPAERGDARPLAGSLRESPPDPTLRLTPVAHRGRRGQDNGSCGGSWVRGPARGAAAPGARAPCATGPRHAWAEPGEWVHGGPASRPGRPAGPAGWRLRGLVGGCGEGLSQGPRLWVGGVLDSLPTLTLQRST